MLQTVNEREKGEGLQKVVLINFAKIFSQSKE